MMILTMMGLNPSPLARDFFHCVLMITLVVLVAWGMECFYQQESSTNVTFFCLLCLYQ